MTVPRGFLIILVSGLVFALGGGLIGYTLAVTAPGYYRAVFSSGREPWFDPVAVGVGLGITQGLVCGLIVGAVVVLAVALYNSRRSVLGVEFPPTNPQHLTRPVERLSEDQGITDRPR
jgi:hypothetical protein